MNQATLQKVLESIRDYHKSLEAQGEEVVTSISWLGGELLILPRSYFEDIMRMEREVFGEEAITSCALGLRVLVITRAISCLCVRVFEVWRLG